MAFQPFALDEYFEDMIQGGISQGKAREDWFQDRTDEASMDLADQAAALKKKMENAAGIFGKKGMFGKLGPYMKTIIPIIATAVGGPAAGALVGTSMAARDSAKRQSQLKRRLEGVKGMQTQKGKYAGTFLENYIGQGLSGIKTDVLGGLTGGKKLGRWLGGAEILLSLLPGLGKVGKKAGEDVTKEVVTDVGEEITENVVKDKVENLVKDIAPWPGTTASLTPSDISVPPMSYLKDIAKIPNIGTRAVMPELPINTLLSGAKDLVKGVGGKYAKTANLLTKPLVPYSGKNFGRNLLSSLTTPSMYAPLLAELYKKQNIGQAEPRLQRAPNPYKRWN